MPRIILASQSPRRKRLLEQIGLDFEVHPSNVDEVSSEQEPSLLVEDLALQKANDVAHSFPDSLIIGSDTLVVLNNEVIGKPRDEDEAAEFLLNLSDTTHLVLTGVAFVKTNKNGQIEGSKTFHEQTKVTFSTLAEEEIRAYAKSGNPLDKAGAYGIQDDLGALFVEKIEGDYYNVVGFPLNRFYREMKTFMPELNIMDT
ncbi:MAG: septum formation inhibitor Maf [Balneola sp.]|jgi:septum formation protein|nr:septum formation inhibitor Maf [Balneola sp.]MBE80401.1 septum formation inhibitor Maf [Balneola sp.]|tara:strand:+ start:19529 stop:20128 length:600 start_codon:yes stop_codon:yes gene_type:complete